MLFQISHIFALRGEKFLAREGFKDVYRKDILFIRKNFPHLKTAKQYRYNSASWTAMGDVYMKAGAYLLALDSYREALKMGNGKDAHLWVCIAEASFRR